LYEFLLSKTIKKALENEGFMVNTKKDADIYFYPC